ncbi:MAG: ATP-binding protein [Oscillochloris sp.]|nr:ATP-binding protein [Oscillochloris sp.]
MARTISPGAAPVAPLRPPPAPPQPFVGRDTERAALERRLEERGVVALTGLAGSGKTALLADHASRSRRKVEWVEIYHGLSDSGEALFWQIARPLADVAPQTWQALHRMAQGAPPYPLTARLQVALAAYARLDAAPLLVIDAMDHLGQPEPIALVSALCDHVASGRAGDLQVAVAGRALPYRMLSYMLPALGGIDLVATQAWAQALGLSLSDEAAAQLVAFTGGVPLALADALASRLSDTTLPLEAERRLWALVAGLSPTELDLLKILTRDAQPALPLERRADLAHLEDMHLVRRSSAEGAQIHPMIRNFLSAQMSRS